MAQHDDERPVWITTHVEDRTFGDTLYEWMERAPWMLISAAAHLLVFFVLMGIPWRWLDDNEEIIVECTLFDVPDEILDEPIEEPEPVLPDEPELFEPSSEPVEALLRPEPPDAVAAPGPAAEDPFDSPADVVFATVAPLGLGGKYGGRAGGGQGGGGGAGRGVPQALSLGLRWLADHQSPEGFWDGDGFMHNRGGEACSCDGDGAATHDVGLTGLALLAFLGNGTTTDAGPYRDALARGVHWLNNQADPDTGLLGSAASAEYLYDHAIATLALAETYYFSKSPRLKRTVQRAVDFIQAARAPYGGWCYDAPSLGDSDTSVTGWMLFALAAARDAGLRVARAALVEGLDVIEQFTDTASGRVGYDSPGSLSSRTAANRSGFPRERGEAMTAVGLLCRIFLADLDPAGSTGEARRKQHAELLAQTPPQWDEDGGGNDMYYWYYGTYAMFQVGGTHWRNWKRAIERAALQSQRKDGDRAGSWDPAGPWGYAGGRVYSTALMVLCLEVYYRYARVLGSR